MKRYIKASVDWNYFNKYSDILDKYMPNEGEGNTLASQAVTAVNKLIFKWYNDGDVYDNTYSLEGFANDISSYANWLYTYLKDAELQDVLLRIADCRNDDDYEDILAGIAGIVLDEDLLESLDRQEKDGSIYTTSGPFKFEYRDYDEDYDY